MISRKLPKIIYFIVCFLLIFEQSGFAQVAAQLDIAGHLSAMHNALTVDKFRPLHLRYLQYDPAQSNFHLLIDKGTLKNPLDKDLEITSKDLLKYFFIGLSLPNNAFWVNLRPDSPDNIIDSKLAQTDIGRILLEADLELKKDTAKATSPETPDGQKYWNSLYKKAGELFGSQNVTIPTLTRPWIVPDEIIISETTDSAYIYKATLKVMLEQDYLKNDAVYNFKDDRSKQLNEYSSQLIRETIVPKLTKEINTAKKYAGLRQVYYSLILSQWFKARNQGKNNYYSAMINRQNLAGLVSKENYSKDTYFKAYQKSFKDGEYNFQTPVSTPYGQVIRSYFSGGITGIAPAVMPASVGALPVTDPATGARITSVPAQARMLQSDTNAGVVIQTDAQGDIVHVMASDVATQVPQRDQGLSLSQLEEKYGVKIEILDRDSFNRRAQRYLGTSNVGRGFGYYDRTTGQFVACILQGNENDRSLVMHEISEALGRQPEGVAKVGAENGNIGKGETLPGTSFVLGRQNGERDIESLRNWQEYQRVNTSMRPGQYSQAGFLAQGEDLVEVLKEDKRIVDALGVSFENLANWLEQSIKTGETSETIINGQRLRIKRIGTRGMQSPPLPGLPGSSGMYWITNVATGESFGTATEMHPDLIRLYGFFEGHTGFRTDPVVMYAVYTGRKVADVVRDLSSSVGINFEIYNAPDQTTKLLYYAGLPSSIPTQAMLDQQLQQRVQELRNSLPQGVTLTVRQGGILVINSPGSGEQPASNIAGLTAYNGKVYLAHLNSYRNFAPEFAEITWNGAHPVSEESLPQEVARYFGINREESQTEQVSPPHQAEGAVKVETNISKGDRLPGTNFVLGRRNTVQDIASLRNWSGYQRVVADMRSGHASEAGFLAPDEDLVELLIQDKLIVDALGISFETISDWLIKALSGHGAAMFNGQSLTVVDRDVSKGGQYSPLPGVGSGSGIYVITNTRTQESVGLVSGLHINLIRQYGFFENTAFRLDPIVFYAVFTGKKVEDVIKEIAPKLGVEFQIEYPSYNRYGFWHGAHLPRVKVLGKIKGEVIFSDKKELTATATQLPIEQDQSSAIAKLRAMTYGEIESRIKEISRSALAGISFRVERADGTPTLIIIQEDIGKSLRVTNVSGFVAHEGRVYLGHLNSDRDFAQEFAVITNAGVNSINEGQLPGETRDYFNRRAQLNSALGAQVSNVNNLDRLLRLLNVLRRSESAPLVSENTSDREIIEYCIEELERLGLIEIEYDSVGNAVVRIVDDIRLYRAGESVRRFVEAIGRWVIDPQGGVRAVNFQGRSMRWQGKWLIVSFKSLLDKDTLQHEQTEIQYRKQGLDWKEAHNRTVQDLGRDEKINIAQAQQYRAGRQDELGANMGLWTPMSQKELDRLFDLLNPSSSILLRTCKIIHDELSLNPYVRVNSKQLNNLFTFFNLYSKSHADDYVLDRLMSVIALSLKGNPKLKINKTLFLSLAQALLIRTHRYADYNAVIKDVEAKHWWVKFAISQAIINNPLLFTDAVEIISNPKVMLAIREPLIDSLFEAILRMNITVKRKDVLKLIGIKDDRIKRQILDKVIEPLSFRNPKLISDVIWDRIEAAYLGEISEFKYMLFYRNMYKNGNPLLDSKLFPYQAQFRSLLGSGKKRVLLMHNIKDGMGDEIIRNATLMQALLDFNPELEIVIYSNRGFLYDHPRVFVKDISLFSENQQFDMIIHHYDKEQRYSDDVESKFQEYLRIFRARTDPQKVYIKSNKANDRFTYEEFFVKGQDVYGGGWTNPEYSAGNVYLPIYRLCADLGLKFRYGVNRVKQSIFTTTSNLEVENYWNDTVIPASSMAVDGRPKKIVVYNGFGGEDISKGYNGSEGGVDNFVEDVRYLIENGFFIILLPNHQSWGDYKVAQEVVKRLKLTPEQEKASVLVAPSPVDKPLLHKYLLDRADYVVAVEGGVMHLAYNMGKELFVLPMAGSGALSQWFPIGAYGEDQGVAPRSRLSPLQKEDAEEVSSSSELDNSVPDIFGEYDEDRESKLAAELFAIGSDGMSLEFINESSPPSIYPSAIVLFFGGKYSLAQARKISRYLRIVEGASRGKPDTKFIVFDPLSIDDAVAEKRTNVRGAMLEQVPQSPKGKDTIEEPGSGPGGGAILEYPNDKLKKAQQLFEQGNYNEAQRLAREAINGNDEDGVFGYQQVIEAFPVETGTGKAARDNLKIAQGILNKANGLASGSSVMQDQSQQRLSAQLSNQGMGGIDFRSLPIVTQARTNLSVNISSNLMNRLTSVNLRQEWSDIERLVNSGIAPSAERIKDYLQASCSQGSAERDLDKVMQCISNILRLEEERCCSTEATLRDILVVLEASRSSAELNQVFLGKTI